MLRDLPVSATPVTFPEQLFLARVSCEYGDSNAGDVEVYKYLQLRQARTQVLTSLLGIYLEGHGDLVSKLITGIIRVIIWVVGMINLLTMTLQVLPKTLNPKP